jgi:hypothetical protein
MDSLTKKLAGYGHGMVVWAVTKSRYWFLNFSDRPFNSYNFLKFSFCLINQLSFRMILLLAGYQISIQR